MSRRGRHKVSKLHMTAREGSKARKMPGNFVILYIPVVARRSSQTKATRKLCEGGEVGENEVYEAYLAKRRTIVAQFQVVVRGRGQVKIPARGEICKVVGDRWRTIEIETTSCETDGLATAIQIIERPRETDIVTNSPMPPTALVTETAAVRTPSAMVRLVPRRACQISNAIHPPKKSIYPDQQRPAKGRWRRCSLTSQLSSHQRIMSGCIFEILGWIDSLKQGKRSTLA